MLQSCPNLPSLSLANLLDVWCQARTVTTWDWAVQLCSDVWQLCWCCALRVCPAWPVLSSGCPELLAAGTCALHMHSHGPAAEHWAPAITSVWQSEKVMLIQNFKCLSCHLKLLPELINKGQVLTEGSQGEDVQSINSVVRKPGMAFSGVARGNPELLIQLKDFHVPLV